MDDPLRGLRGGGTASLASECSLFPETHPEGLGPDSSRTWSGTNITSVRSFSEVVE